MLSYVNYDRESYILVVDDDDTLLKFFKIHLNKFFSRVIVVKNGKEAIEMMKEKAIDLIISDISMPRLDGHELTKRVHKNDPLIPVLLISGANLSDEKEMECIEDAEGYLRKPFSVEQLHDYITLGMQRREKLKALSLVMKDPKNLRKLISGRCKLERCVLAEQREEAQQLLNTIRKKIVA